MSDGTPGATGAAATTGGADPAATTTVAGTAAAASATGAATATAAGNGAATPAVPWLGEADELTVGYVQNKGWKNPADTVSSYRNLEKLLGEDRAGRTVVLPGENATPEEVAAFHAKLGRPTEAKQYNIKVPEGQDPAFAETAKTWFHEAGLTDKQAQAVAAKWNEYAGGVAKGQEEARIARTQADAAALQTEWGAAHQQNVTLAQNTRKALGVSDAEVDGIANVLGLKRTVEMFHKLGSRTGEADFVAGESGGFNSVLTPGQAKAKIAALRSDAEFNKNYLSGNAGAKAEMTRLHQLAYPDPQK